MADVAALQELIEPEVEAEGLSLVRVKLTGGTSDPTIQVMAERPDTRQLSIEECERLHRRIAEAHDGISDDYRLEVCSPGIDRPLTRPADYRRLGGARGPDRPRREGGRRASRCRAPCSGSTARTC